MQLNLSEWYRDEFFRRHLQRLREIGRERELAGTIVRYPDGRVEHVRIQKAGPRPL